jgi:hypothetical protein
MCAQPFVSPPQHRGRTDTLLYWVICKAGRISKRANVPELRFQILENSSSAAPTVIFCCNDFTILLTKLFVAGSIFLFLQAPIEGTQ